ncbi:MAG: zinc-dependent alcohol dehydrogenase family protein [Caldilineaceae bacterium]
MQAVIFPQAEAITVEHVDDPTCGPDEVIVQVGMSGICGTDLHIYRNEYMSNFPLIPGHEFGGRIVEMGSAVQMGFQIGDRVAVDPNLYCGYCDFCRREQSNHCQNLKIVGVTQAGAFAEYVTVPAKACYRVPDSLTDNQMAFIEPLACIAYGMSRLRVPPADKVLLFGAGPIGLLLLQALRHAGASEIVVVEKQSDRLALAAQLGATQTLPVSAELTAQLKEIAPHGSGIVADATGVPPVIEAGFQYLRPRGQYLMFGVAPMTAQINLRPYDVFRNDWHILGSFALCYTFQQSIAWLETSVIDVSQLVSHTAPLADFPKLFQQFAAGQTLKVHLQP